MNRRNFMAQLAAAAATPRPNVLIYITDDESWLERSAYGWSKLPTPHFDRVAREGVLFTHAYTSAPSCAPSRAALLTGRNFWELEEGAFIQAWLPEKFPLLPDLMEAGGYAAGFTGKGWGPGVLPPNSTRQRNPAGEAFNRIRNAVREEAMSGIDYAANLAEFLDRRPSGQPFCFWAGSTEPHDPHAPTNHQRLREYGFGLEAVRIPDYLPDNEESRRQRGDFAFEIRHADEDLGKILKVLEARRELDNTIVIVTADNGTAIPRSKTNVYDWGVRVPLAIRWPKAIAAGRRVDDFVNFIDFASTILDAAGIPAPRGMSGRSFLDVLRAKGSGRVDTRRSWTCAGLEWHGEFDPVSYAARTIRDERWQYVVNYGRRPMDGRSPEKKEELRPREELYDCSRDPWEWNNLAESRAHADVKRRLRQQLEQYQRKTGDPRVTGAMQTFERTRQFVQERKRKGYPAGLN